MIEKDGIVFHGSCIKHEIQALHNTVLLSTDKQSDMKVTVFDEEAMNEALIKDVQKRIKSRKKRLQHQQKQSRKGFRNTARQQNRKFSAINASEASGFSEMQSVADGSCYDNSV